MASIYARGEVLWMKFKNAAGKPDCKSTGYRKGDQARALELAKETERLAKIERDARTSVACPAPRAQPSATPAKVRRVPVAARAPIGPAAESGALTVKAYADEWIGKRRERGVATVNDEETRLRLHVLPLIGHMAIADVRPKHIRDLVLALRAKTSDAPKCKDDKLAPRTVLHCFATVRRLFKSAIIDEHIAATPVVVEKGILPKNVDKDPAWRSTAIFDRAELVTLISDPRIPPDRRVLHTLKGPCALRHGEAAGLTIGAYDPRCRPLGKLTVSRSYERDGTKTQITREVPVHPAAAAILDEWIATGWRQTYGRDPRPEDLLVPTLRMKARKAADADDDFVADLGTLGLRHRRGHDLRRTLITLAQVDGASRDVLKSITHGLSEADVMNLYTTFPWPTMCEAIACVRIELPAGDAPTASASDATANDNAEEIAPLALAAGRATVASYSGHCSSPNLSQSQGLGTLIDASLRFRKP